MTTTTRARTLVGQSSGTAARSATMSACTRPRSSSTAAHGRPSGSGDWSDAGIGGAARRPPAGGAPGPAPRARRGGAPASAAARQRPPPRPPPRSAGGVALAFGGGGGDLALALRRDELVALLLGLLLLDLLGLDRLLVVGVEADVGEGGLLQFDAVLGEPLRDAGLHVRLDRLPPD